MKKRVLGEERPLKGGDYIDSVLDKTNTSGRRTEDILLEKIRVKANVRTDYDADKLEELVASIHQKGQIEPIMVMASPDGVYDIVYGHRRYKALITLNQRYPGEYLKVNCFVAADDAYTPEEIREIQITENLIRDNLTTNELRVALLYFREKGLSCREIGEKFGQKEGYIKQLFSSIKTLAKNPELDELMKSDVNVTLSDIQEVRMLPAKYQIRLIEAKMKGEIKSVKELRERVLRLKEELFSGYRDDRQARQRYEVLDIRPDRSVKVKSFSFHPGKLNNDDRDRLRKIVVELSQLLEGKDA